jgi:deoxyxylulose-5-phosphate synthase
VKKQKIIYKPWHSYDFMETKGEIIEYLKLSIEEDTPEKFINSINNVLKSKYFKNKNSVKSIDNDFKNIYNLLKSLGLKFELIKDKTKQKQTIKPTIKEEINYINKPLINKELNKEIRY